MKISHFRGLSSRSVFSTIAFTLIELLVVISIIAVLASLSIPVGLQVQVAAKKTSARNDLTTMTTAVRGFYVDYGHYPQPPTVPTNDFSYGPSSLGGCQSNDLLFNTLLYPPGYTEINPSAPQNPRQVKYADVPYCKNSSAPKSGIVQTTVGNLKAGMWVDPWGTPYVVFIDNDYDNCITVSNVFNSGIGVSGTVPISCGAASVGLYATQPGNSTTTHPYNKSYDILSWQ